MTIALKLLMGLYLIIPACFLAVGLDQYFFHSSLLNILPKSPNNIFLFSLFFILPHIVASSVTLIDKEYIQFYKKKLFYSLAFSLILALIFAYLMPKRTYLMVFGLMTLYHVIGQQLGLTAAFSGVRGRLFLTWKYFSLLTATLVSFLIYIPEQGGFLNYSYLKVALVLVYLILFFITYACKKRSKSNGGKKYFWLNYLLILSVFFCIHC